MRKTSPKNYPPSIKRHFRDEINTLNGEKLKRGVSSRIIQWEKSKGPEFIYQLFDSHLMNL